MKKQRNIRKYIILPVSYLLLNLVEEFLIYKTELMINPWLRTLLVIFILLLGISMVAFVIVPFLEGGLQNLHKSSKQHGMAGEIAFTIGLIAMIYAVYFVVYAQADGLEGLLPPILKN